jgi:hypothetical protein
MCSHPPWSFKVFPLTCFKVALGRLQHAMAMLEMKGVMAEAAIRGMWGCSHPPAMCASPSSHAMCRQRSWST